MTILAYTNGFEAQTHRTWQNTTLTAASVTGGAARSGSYGLRLNPSAAASGLSYSLSIGAVYAMVGRIYVKFPGSLPGADIDFMRLANGTDSYRFEFRNSDDAIVVKGYDAGVLIETQTGPTIVADSWYRIDFHVHGGSASGGEFLDWSVNDTAYARLDDSTGYASPSTWMLGSSTSQTMDVYFDDAVVIWNTVSGETSEIDAIYPIGPGYVKRLAPTGVGTHQNDTSFGTSSGSIADSWQLIDNLPIDTTTGYIEQTVIGASDYLEYTLDNLAADETNPRVVSCFFSKRSSGIASNNAGIYVIDGSNINEIEDSVWTDTSSPWQTIDTGAVPVAGTGTDRYDAGASGWTRDRVNALLLRWGFSSDVDAIPRLPAAHLEVEVEGVDLNAQTKTHSINSLLQKTTTATYSMESSVGDFLLLTYSLTASIIILGEETYDLDVFLTGLANKTHGIDAVAAKSGITKTYSIESYRTLGGMYTNTHSINSYLTAPSSASTHSLDTIAKKAVSTTYQMQAYIFSPRGLSTYSIDVSIIDEFTNPELNPDLETALAASVVRPRLLLSRIISRNGTLVNSPSITVSDSGHAVSSRNKTLIDGYDRASMKWAFADGDATTNGGYRLFPDLTKVEADVYQERQKRPWITSSLTDSSGAFTPDIVFTIQYNSPNVYNMVQIVGEKYGRNGAGIITDVEFEYSDNGSTWTSIGSFSGLDCVEPHRVQAYYYYDQDLTSYVWSTDRDAFLRNSDGYALATVTHPYLKVTVRSISVDTGRPTGERPRYGQFYEVGCHLWDAGIQAMQITSFSIDEQRDTSSQTLSPIGTSTANTFSLTGTLAGETTPYYNDFINPYSPNHDQYQGAVYLASFGVEVAPGEYTYVDYGTFLADDMNISAPDGSVNISGRDYSRLLQEEKMPEMVYVGQTLHKVIQDVVERAGIEKYDIDTTVYTLEELAVGLSQDFISDDEYTNIQKNNIIWTQDQTCWEFLQTVAYADLGVFYFDKNNVFVFKSKEDLLRSDDPADYVLTEDDDIISFNSTHEIMKNAFTVNYRVPERTKTQVGLWDSTANVILDATALSANISATDETIPVGDVSDWQREGYAQIENEIIKYKSRDDTNFFECERGYLGTIPASHTVDNTNNYWTFGAGTWAISGGVLSATDSGDNGWRTTLTTNDVQTDTTGFNMYASVTINSSPWTAAFIIRGNNTNNHYRAVFRCAQLGTQFPGITASSGEALYEIQEVDGGVVTTLKSASWGKTRTRARMLSGVPTMIRVQVHDDEIALFVRGIRVLSYTIKSTDRQIALPAKIGFAHKGTGPTTFENCWVESLPEDKEGQTIIFSDTFGRPIKEIRRFDVTYAPYGGTAEDSIATPPCWGIRHHITSPNSFTVLHSRIGPFTATIYVRNDLDALALLSGERGGQSGSLRESFYLNGYAVRNSLEIKHLDEQDDALIARYQRQELLADIPWVQSKTHAQYLLNYLIDVYKKPVVFLDVEIAPNILLNLGDIVSLLATDAVWFPAISDDTRFYVVGIGTSFDEGGITQNLRLRSMT